MEQQQSLIFLYVVFFLSIALYIAGGFITSAFVIPLQYEQSKVKNGLVVLRKYMLKKGVLSLVVIIFSILALTLRFLPLEEHMYRYIIVTIIFVHALGTCSKSVVDYRIYHQQYSEDSKKLHELFENHELANSEFDKVS